MSTTLHRDSWDQYVVITERQIAELSAIASDMLALLDDLPVKHPQQSERRDELRKRLGIYQQTTLEKD